MQFLHIRNCVQELDSEDFDCCCTDTGPLSGLKNSFTARWNGPWIGVDLSYEYCKTLFFASAEYHWPTFRGKAHWNLRTDFVKDPRQRADGQGQLYSLGAKYPIAKQWLIGLELGYLSFNTHGGHATLFFSDENANLKLNDTHWTSFDALFSLTYSL
jgi:hypothetical protein